MVGEPDELERLWTPHRLDYVRGGAKATGPEQPEGCPFCLAPSLPDEESLVVARGERVYAVLNRYPYNPGHLLICPYRHVADYPDLDAAETVEFAQFSQAAMTAIRRVGAPHGFNLGINQGGAAGAGVAGHLHQHVVPRWSGDTNYMPVIGRTKTVPQLLADTRRLVADAWADLAPTGRRRPRRVARPADAVPAPAGQATQRPRARSKTMTPTGDAAPAGAPRRPRPS